ncbi:MAG: hypothetical protein C5B50_25740 [Verrucomicrobia bacterium]|nr:MAG: hypothetical protein C5B50_25740 [Verrucomicrobiota bacterium]
MRTRRQDRKQRTEDRNQRTENRGQTAEDRTENPVSSIQYPVTSFRFTFHVSRFTPLLGVFLLIPSALAQRPLGIDVSSYQGSPNWSSVKGSGVVFAYAKATEGVSINDSSFAYNQNNGKSAGVYMGAYDFAHPNLNSPSSEVSHFWSVAGPYVKADGKTLMPMLDFEVFSGVTGASSYSDWANQWCNGIVNDAKSAGLKVTPTIYVSECNASHFNSTVTGWIPFIANYNGQNLYTGNPCGSPCSCSPWGTWSCWQVSDSGAIGGISGNCDLDTFNGNTAGMTAKLLVTANSFNDSTYVNASMPTAVLTGQVFTATVTMNNSGTIAWSSGGSNPYRLGSQSPQDNTTWGFSRVNLPSSPINPGANVTFTFDCTAPMTKGTYTFAWRMVKEGVEWFGDTLSVPITVDLPGTSLSGGWWGNKDINPTSFGGTWATTGDCGTYWYIFSRYTDCTTRGFNMTFNCGFVWNGRGYIHMDWVNDASQAATILTMRYRSQAGSLTGETSTWNDCAHTCSWQSIKDAEVPDVYQFNGIYRNANEDSTATCGSNCGSAPSAGREIHMYGDKWVYLNDWVVFGGFGNTAGVSTVGFGFSNPFGENGLYVYGAIDTTHGNYFANNLYGGHVPYRVQTGDCGAATLSNFLDFKGNAGMNGNNNCNNCDGYAFGWVQAVSSGAGPQWGVGSDDGNRIWLNGTLIADNNAARGLTWDQDRFRPTGMSGGWNRVLFKVHNGTSAASGVISLHHGTDFHQVEPSVYMQPDRYTGFSVGYEQDGWYPTITPSAVYTTSSPVNAGSYYGNDTTVDISGTSGINSGSPVPYWRTMQFQWGYGIAGDSNFADVSDSPTSTSWSHEETGVTGHRRFHLFAVSKSGRTSFQNSGSAGGWTWSDSGNYARYYDIYVDNVAPVNPSFSSVTVAGTNQVNLAWTIPLDRGVNIANGATEATTGISSGGANGYIRGDVGVQAYRDGAGISGWVTATSFSDTGLVANTAHTYTIEARDNNSQSRGNWNNLTGQQNSNTVWTLSMPPGTGSLTPDQTNPPVTGTVSWMAEGDFGDGTIQYYRYAWDTSPSHTWSGSEPQWSSGTLATVPNSTGNWYLHVKGYNGNDVANGSYDYSVTAVMATSATSLASSQNPSGTGSNVTFTAAVTAVTGSATPSGNVVFSANGAPFSTNAVVSGSASASMVFGSAGTNTIAAQYVGDTSFLGSSDNLQQIVQSTVTCSQTNLLLGITANADNTFTLTFQGTPQAGYYVVGNSNVVGGAWIALPGSTNVATTNSGLWSITVSNSALQQFYRSVAITPCP